MFRIKSGVLLLDSIVVSSGAPQGSCLCYFSHLTMDCNVQLIAGDINIVLPVSSTADNLALQSAECGLPTVTCPLNLGKTKDVNFLHEEEYEGFKKFISDLLELIECQVCFGILDSSLSLCENGHGICVSCLNNYETCPTCKRGYVPHIPTLLSQILESLPEPCSFADIGCDKFLFSKQNEHTNFCKFRPTTCKLKSCDWKGPVKDVVDHVRNCKNNTENALCEIFEVDTQTTQTYLFDKSQDAGFFTPIIFQNKLFWKYFYRNFSSKRITYRLYHIHTSKPTQKYSLVVTFDKGETKSTCCLKGSYGLENHTEGEKDDDIGCVISDNDLERYYDSEANGYNFTEKLVVEDFCN